MQVRRTEILITGGAGFIGTNLANALEHAGANVMIADALIDEHGGNSFHLKQFSPKAKFLQVAVESGHADFTAMVRQADIIYHLAGQSHHWASLEDPFSDLQHNCKSTLALLDTCRQHNPKARIIFTSTRQVYGTPVRLPVDETHPLQAVDVNGIHKLTAEQYLRLYHNLFGIPVTITRLTNTYGPGMRISDDKQSFLGHWIRQALQGKPFDVWGGHQLRDFTFVNDVVKALIALADIKSESVGIFNIGGKEVFRLSDIAALLTSLTGTQHRIIPFPEERRKIEIGDFYTDYSRLSHATGWQPETTMDAGMEQTLAYYNTNLSHYLQ
ncbi:MAG: NAD-dependent epimerase/dehydratase family protein [Saprospiraceae bacterium]|jgi:nucleoside-diphosphate-sugar epimerase|nr:NAD-dependent epimerase/dehydratase family protein [Saprospiraceae bacterium]